MSLQVSEQAVIGQRGAAANDAAGSTSDDAPRRDAQHPWSKSYHGIAADHRLKSSAFRVLISLTYWALDRDSTTVSDGSISEYTGLSVSQVKRVLTQLIGFGYITIRDFKPTSLDRTGREILLCWVTNPSIIPSPPSRGRKSAKEYKATTRRKLPTTVPALDLRRTSSLGNERYPRSPVSDPIAHPRSIVSLIDGRYPRSLVSDKEEGIQEPLKKEPRKGEKLADADPPPH